MTIDYTNLDLPPSVLRDIQRDVRAMEFEIEQLRAERDELRKKVERYEQEIEELTELIWDGVDRR